MKKGRVKNVSKALISASFRGLAVFAIFGMALYAYAISYPTQPGPVTGVVGLYVGKTAPYNGNRGGYGAVNTLCDNVEEGAHVCTAMEMINTYNHAPSGPIASETASLWINNGPPGYIVYVSNDCEGWQMTSSTQFGSIWNTQKDSSSNTSCDLTRSFACCK